jgi:hypothetical protein
MTFDPATVKRISIADYPTMVDAKDYDKLLQRAIDLERALGSLVDSIEDAGGHDENGDVFDISEACDLLDGPYKPLHPQPTKPAESPLTEAELRGAQQLCVAMGECTATYYLALLIGEVERLLAQNIRLLSELNTALKAIDPKALQSTRDYAIELACKGHYENKRIAELEVFVMEVSNFALNNEGQDDWMEIERDIISLCDHAALLVKGNQ